MRAKVAILAVALLAVSSGCHEITAGDNSQWTIRVYWEPTENSSVFQGTVVVEGEPGENSAKDVKVQFLTRNEEVLKELSLGDMGTHDRREKFSIEMGVKPETVAVKLKVDEKPSEVGWLKRREAGGYEPIWIAGKNTSQYTY